VSPQKKKKEAGGQIYSLLKRNWAAKIRYSIFCLQKYDFFPSKKYAINETLGAQGGSRNDFHHF
jgi:hypothetical protein